MTAPLAALPGKLPPGERVLWQGRPCWRTLARRAFHVRKLAVYFAILLAWYAATVFRPHMPQGDAALATLRMAGVALTAVGLICLYAWLSSRAALYTITNRRVILRAGIAMPITFNLPFAKIHAAGLKTWADGSGDIALTLTPPDRLGYFVLWPHAKPWRMAHTEPMLRCLPEAQSVAQTLGRALAAAAAMPVPASPEGASASAAARPRAPALA